MSKAKTGKNHPMFGKQLSKEHKRKLSKRKKGKNNPMFGKQFSKEHRKKISKQKNSSGYYNVSKKRDKNYKEGFCWRYRWTDKEGKRKEIRSNNIKKLEKKVKEKGLIWEKITN